MNRYARQILLPQVGDAGQERLARSRVVVIGCGALGTVAADYLARAGVGHLTIVDRDIVEETNLQRQTLFTTTDVLAGTPKAVAAAERLTAVNPRIVVVPFVADVHQDNVESIIGVDENRADVIVDGTDNAETRYLVNDACVKHGVPWIYGAAVGVEGRAMAIDSPRTPCLRCIFPEAPLPGDMQTCDTAGVLGPAAGVVASLQAAAALRLMVGDGAVNELVTINAWTMRLRNISTTDARRADCPTCNQRRFDFLNATSSATSVLCGRDSVQVRLSERRLDLAQIGTQLAKVGTAERTPYLLRFVPRDPDSFRLTLFADGRAIVHGVTDPGRARSFVAKWISA